MPCTNPRPLVHTSHRLHRRGLAFEWKAEEAPRPWTNLWHENCSRRFFPWLHTVAPLHIGSCGAPPVYELVYAAVYAAVYAPPVYEPVYAAANFCSYIR